MSCMLLKRMSYNHSLVNESFKRYRYHERDKEIARTFSFFFFDYMSAIVHIVS